VIGASAGSISLLRQLFAALPADYPAAVFVVVHVAPESPPILDSLIGRVSNMPAVLARAGARIRRSTITIAPPDLHLMLQPDGVVVTHGPRENRYRPSIDVLFRSAAVAFGSRVTGVILSGMLDDGAAGLWAVKRRGGMAVVQDPTDAEFADLPTNAIAATRVDHVVPVSDMPSLLMRIANETLSGVEEPVPVQMAKEVRIASRGDTSMEELDELGERVPLTCPECGGSLWEMGDGGPRYRCHTGHGYTLGTLTAEQANQVEAALWASLRRLEESERLSRHMESTARAMGNERSAQYHADMARANAGHAETLRKILREKADVRVDQAANE
jgi:two-component system chemotaxis response regulator CheB